MTKRSPRSSSSRSRVSSSRSRRPESGGIGGRITALLTAIVAGVVFVITQCSGGGQPGLFPTSTPFGAVGPSTRPASGIVTLPPSSITLTPGLVTPIELPLGTGAQARFWQVYFTMPSGSRDASTYVNGIDVALAAMIGAAQRTVDIAAYEFNNRALTDALLAAAARGVRVRMVTDDDAGLHDADSTVPELIAGGVAVVDDDRSALMHHKFVIIDSTLVWTGSWNYTVNDTYRNNNNALVLRSRQAVSNFQAEFDEMFVSGRFGPTSPANTPNSSFTQDGIPIEVYFSPEDEVVPALVRAIGGATRSIRFMAFSFTLDEVAQAVLARAAAGVGVQGIYETTGSQTEFSTLRTLFCAGLDVRQDGSPFILHHKVFIIDETTVITGSFNFSANATENNDENVVIIRDPLLAAQYVAEFERRLAESRVPGLAC